MKRSPLMSTSARDWNTLEVMLMAAAARHLYDYPSSTVLGTPKWLSEEQTVLRRLGKFCFAVWMATLVLRYWVLAKKMCQIMMVLVVML